MDEILTPRLRLRTLTAADVSDDYIAWLTDPEINQYLETRHSHQDRERMSEFVLAVAQRENEHLFGIFLRGGGRHIGNIKVGPIHLHHRLGDVSLLIGARDCWGNGYAAEAIAGVSRFAFEELGVAKLSASMYAPNVGSTNAFLKVGYRREGLRRDHYQLAGGRCDLVELGLLPADLPPESA